MECGNVLKALAQAAPVQEIGRGNLAELAAPERLQRHNPIRCRIFERAQEYCVDDTEDCAAGPNAKRESNHDNAGKSRILDKHAKSITCIPHEILYHTASPHRCNKRHCG